MTNVKICLWIGSIINQLGAHSHILINPKLTNFVELNLFTWQNLADLNKNKRSSWISQEIIQTSVRGAEQTTYDRIIVA